MGLQPTIDPEAQAFTNDYLISKVFEAIRMRFKESLPETFYRDNYRRACLILKVEGASKLYASLLPFAEAQASCKAQDARRQESHLKQLAGTFPDVVRLARISQRKGDHDAVDV